MNCTIITIGDEILIGQTVDTNSAWMASRLNEIGIQIVQILSIADKDQAIKNAAQIAEASSDLVLITGGLGPTKDDITKLSMAQYYGVPLEFNEYNWKTIQEYFKGRNRPVKESHRQQCYLPKGVITLENKLGTAPGMWFEQNDTIFVNMPGVPYEMKYIMANGVLPRLKSLSPIGIYHRNIMTAGRGESTIADDISDLLEAAGDSIKIAYLPKVGTVRIRLSATYAKGEETVHRNNVDLLASQIEKRLGHIVYASTDVSIEEAFLELCKAKGVTMGTAESCTGGKIAHKLTSIPGSSRVYMGSVIAYDNQVKKDLLHVNQTTLEEHGAVSEQTVREMLTGLLNSLPMDYGIAVSGIAGPGGGTVEKPVGTIWVAYGSKDEQKAVKLSINKDRVQNIEYASVMALNQLRLFINSEKR